MKRLFDFLSAGAALILLSPAILLLIWIVRRNSSGPGIFRQVRVGRDGKWFTCYKMRTMTVDTPDRPSHEVSQSSLTSIGAVLRRTKLDELPQLYNVVLGEMSLVGPRPCLPTQVELIEARRASGALDIRPGITGLAQIQGVDMSEPVRLAGIDGEYARSQSFWGDLSIIMRTVFGAGRGADRVAADASVRPYRIEDADALLETIAARRKIVVTGASGFVGREVLDVLSARTDVAVVGLFRSAGGVAQGCLPLIVEDIGAPAVEQQLSKVLQGAKALVHLAAVTPASGAADLTQTNVELSRMLATLAARSGVERFVFLSSARVHGETTSGALTEESPLAGEDAYAVSKKAAEQSIADIARQEGLAFTIIRPPLVYGANIKGVFRALALAAAKGIPLPLGGAASNRRDLIGVRNLALFIDRALDHPGAANQTFLICDGAPMSTRGLVEAMASAAGRPARLVDIPVAWIRRLAGLGGVGGMVERLLGDFEIDGSKAQKALNWRSPEPPSFDLERMMSALASEKK